MSLGELIESVNLIVQSEPSKLVEFATRWQQVSNAAAGQAPVVTRGVTDVEFDSKGAMAQQMTRYRLQTGDGMNALSGGAGAVADGLRDIAPRVAKIRNDLFEAMIAVDLAIAGIAIGVAFPPASLVAAVAGAVLGGGLLMTITNLVSDYNVEMTTLATALNTAQAKLRPLEDLMHNAGGVIPDAPKVALVN